MRSRDGDDGERWKEEEREGERGCESPSSDNKAFPMTPPSGQELKPGNRTAAALKMGIRRCRERNSGGEEMEMSKGKDLKCCGRVTFIKLGVLWKSCRSEPITSLLSLDLCRARKAEESR